ncbi:PKD domain-containing protein [Luteimicrobium subarcticum]|uniref:PKD domain-containing protein n=1 Tax=Luteimicrobium subarcticum TaxID=620910 RepID=UPI000C23E846|nr:hypothetical protein [Luteimicrobium subarcticum]
MSTLPTDGTPTSFGGHADGNDVDVVGTSGSDSSDSVADPHDTKKPALPATTEYRRLSSSWCASSTNPAVVAVCKVWFLVATETTDCAAATLLFVRHREIDPDGTPGPWSEYEPAETQPTCTVTIDDIDHALTRDFATVHLAPPPLTVQPATPDVLINVPVIVHTTATPQTLTTTVLDTPVDIEATPTRYTWNFHDGPTRTTTTPGHPYPTSDIQHTYASPGPTTITLTTTWTVRFRVHGQTTWHDATGTATTTSPTHHLTVVTRTTHLVEDPLDP